MLLDVSRALKNPGQSYPLEGDVLLHDMVILDDPVSFGPMKVKGCFVGSGNSVSVKGTISGRLKSRCCRCLEAVESGIEATLDERFEKEPAADDPDLRPLTGGAVDLYDSVKDAVLLEMPMRYLCKSDCRGLCPVCGTNLNREGCSCQGEPVPSSELGLRIESAMREKNVLSEDREV